MTMRKRIPVLLLLVCLVGAALVSCGGKQGESAAAQSGQTTSAITAATDGVDEYGRPVIGCEVITAKKTFDDEEIFILAAEDRRYETYDENGVAGDTMNEALYSRNMYVENALRMTINYVYSVYNSRNAAMMQRIRNSTQGAEGPYDLVLPHAYYSTPLIEENRCSNLLEVSNLDFEKPWWNGSMNEEMSVNGQLYVAIGDFALSSIRNTFCMFYNKNILRDFNGQINLYEVVDDREWTQEKFRTLVKDVYSDRDDVPGKSAGDTFGFVISDHAFNADAFLAGFNVKVTNRMADGSVMVGFGDALSIDAFNVTQELYYLDETFLCERHDYETARIMFAKGHALFVADMFCMTDTIGKEMEGYGIIPMPMLDENQRDYTSTSQESFSALIIPSNIKGEELERTTAALEVLCYASYNKIVPLYFEKILKLRYSPEVDDSRMFDLILNSRYYNFGFVYSNSISNILWSWRGNLYKTEVNISRVWNVENGATYDTALEKLMRYFYPETA